MTYSQIKSLATFLCVGLILISCDSTQPTLSKNVLARVGNEYLTIQEAQKNIPEYILEQDSAGALSQFREEWVKQRVLLQEASRLGLSQKKEIQQKLRKAREEVLRQALKNYIIASQSDDLKVTDEEARSYYQAHKEQFVLEEEFVRFRHMRTRTLSDSRAARQDLLGGIPWPEVAREYAIDPEMAIHESEQYWPISMAAKNIDIMHRYLNIIGQSEISPIQRVNGIYHFVQLMDERAKGEHPDLDWLIEQIKDWMILNKRQRNFSSYAKNLYLKAKSNNEVELYNVLPTQINPKNTSEDTLKSNTKNE